MTRGRRGARSAALPVDERAHPRQPLELPVTILAAGNRTDGAIQLTTRDLSLAGAFVRAGMLLEVGETFTLELRLPDGRAVTARGHVARVVRGRLGGTVEPGMGVAFTELDDEAREALQQLLQTA